MADHILALDQGTTSSRAIIFDGECNAIAKAQREFKQIYPSPGHVEHDPLEIWGTQLAAAQEVLQQSKLAPEDIAGIGITNQRETVVIWDKKTGQPVHNAIVWQSRITSSICDRLKADGLTDLVQQKTGLIIDAYFSGTKIQYILDKVPGLRERANKGEVLCGTIDTFLLWNLSGGKLHVTDPTNACRTMLFNIHTLDWDEELLKILNIPREILPEVQPTSFVYGDTNSQLFGKSIPVAAMVGDQQGATFGQCCFEKGTAKNTYGTGCFMLLNTGSEPVKSNNGLLTTVAWQLGDKVTYCLEGSIFIAGAVVQWLRDEMQFFTDSAEIEKLAAEAKDTGGVYLVPAFVGLGAPYWDQDARGTITGITRGTNRSHLARAALESMAYQTADVLTAMTSDSGIDLKFLKVDGGACANDMLMQFQADILGVSVERPQILESTALGAAFLAGLATGVWKDMDTIASSWALDKEFVPSMTEDNRDKLYSGWKEAVRRTLSAT
ncbi:Glycerol kinase [Polystyrenella longa]|uniref:Glycerol kinase n=1 Tax=Polystyrenella longa TaxID=2528007 RepID=A0A518CPB9_9PLAN|nr:glycerol kinase GlpK [Polystyrenella longa]QDU81076.1 Glycerol kinase [Polystyrenella longa]